MSKLKTIWKTVTVSRNPFTVLSIKGNEKRRKVTFRNGFTFCLTWPQFRIFRDNYPTLNAYSIVQVDDNHFKISNERSEVLCDWTLMPIMFDLMQEYGIHEEKGIYHLKNEKVEVFGSLAMLICIQELRTGEYEYYYKDKVVLDVGGFEGESAVYFWRKGAKKVIIYEPVSSHVQFIEKNVELNHIEAEIHQSGVGNKNGAQTVEYETADPGFGILSKGSKHVEIKITATSDVIVESGADVAKFDCEGAEISLVDVQDEIIRRIPYYIIEVHSTEIRKNILEKFTNAGFHLEKETAKANQLSVMTLKRG